MTTSSLIFAAAGVSTGTPYVTWTNATPNNLLNGNTLAAVGITTNGSVLLASCTGGTSYGGFGNTTGTTFTYNGVAATIGQVAYGNSVWVRARNGSSTGVDYSPDGTVTWTTALTNVAYAVTGLRFANGRFFAMGASGQMSTSTDGATWSALAPGGTTQYNCVAWTGSVYVAVGQNGICVTSPDLVTWTSRSTGVTDALRAVEYKSGVLVAVGANRRILRSTDNGVSWTSQSYVSGGFTYNDVRATPTKFITCGTSPETVTPGPQVLYSSDGVTWTQATIPAIDICYALLQIAVIGETAYIIGTMAITTGGSRYSFIISYTTSGTTCSIFAIGQPFGAVTYISATNKWFASCSGLMYVSSDGYSWTPYFIGISGGAAIGIVSKVAYGAGVYVVGATNGIYSSTNGTTWTRVSTQASVNNIVYAASKFVATAAAGLVNSSTDGVTWTAFGLGPAAGFRTNALVYALGKWYCGTSTTMITSVDGVTGWTTIASTPPSLGMTYTGVNFVNVNTASYVGTSPDCITWTQRNPGYNSTTMSAVDYNSTLNVVSVGGNTASRYSTSTDHGVTWTVRTTNVLGTGTTTFAINGIASDSIGSSIVCTAGLIKRTP